MAVVLIGHVVFVIRVRVLVTIYARVKATQGLGCSITIRQKNGEDSVKTFASRTRRLEGEYETAAAST